MTTTLDMLGINTAVMAASLAFYKLLGVDVPPMPPEGEPYTECTLPNGLRISWNDVEMVKKVYPDWEPARGHRLGMAFLCDNPAAVDTTWQAVVDAGFDSVKEPFDAFWGQRYAMVEDPDGNIVDLFAPLG